MRAWIYWEEKRKSVRQEIILFQFHLWSRDPLAKIYTSRPHSSYEEKMEIDPRRKKKKRKKQSLFFWSLIYCRKMFVLERSVNQNLYSNPPEELIGELTTLTSLPNNMNYPQWWVTSHISIYSVYFIFASNLLEKKLDCRECHVFGHYLSLTNSKHSQFFFLSLFYTFPLTLENAWSTGFSW